MNPSWHGNITAGVQRRRILTGRIPYIADFKPANCFTNLSRVNIGVEVQTHSPCKETSAFDRGRDGGREGEGRERGGRGEGEKERERGGRDRERREGWRAEGGREGEIESGGRERREGGKEGGRERGIESEGREGRKEGRRYVRERGAEGGREG